MPTYLNRNGLKALFEQCAVIIPLIVVGAMCKLSSSGSATRTSLYLDILPKALLQAKLKENPSSHHRDGHARPLRPLSRKERAILFERSSTRLEANAAATVCRCTGRPAIAQTHHLATVSLRHIRHLIQLFNTKASFLAQNATHPPGLAIPFGQNILQSSRRLRSAPRMLELASAQCNAPLWLSLPFGKNNLQPIH